MLTALWSGKAVHQAMFSAYAEAGATLWLEHLHDYRGTRAELMELIRLPCRSRSPSYDMSGTA